jgi:ABC-type branched-subunit amino acid transport system substrate-binding protein
VRNTTAKQKGLGVVILAIVLAGLLFLTACAPRPVGEKETAQFAWILPITGAGSPTAQAMLMGGQDYIRYSNEQESIPGVNIELLWRDSALQTPLFISQYERLVADGAPLIGGVEFSPLIGLRSSFERDEVVSFEIGAGYHELAYPTFAWHYGMCPTMGEMTAAVLDYFMGNWREETPPRLAFVGVDTAFGYESRYATGYARSLGFEVLPWEAVPVVVLDDTVQLLRLKQEGADLVHLQGPETASGPILRDTERLGLVGEFQFAGIAASMGERAQQMAPVGSEGFLLSKRWPELNETEVLGIELMINNMMKYYGAVKAEAQVGESYTTSWAAAAVICEAITRAIENVGYENLDGPAIKEALDGMKDFDVYGLGSITYKPDDHRGITRMAVCEVRGGEIVRASDWREAPSARDWEYE